MNVFVVSKNNVVEGFFQTNKLAKRYIDECSDGAQRRVWSFSDLLTAAGLKMGEVVDFIKENDWPSVMQAHE